MAAVDVLIPTCDRPAALAVTLTALIAQTFDDYDVTISDQGELRSACESGEVTAAIRVLQLHGHRVSLRQHLPRMGMAEQRNFLLEQAAAPRALFLDDDLILEAGVLERMMLTLEEQHCGFVGMAPIGLSYRDDVRPQEQQFEAWAEGVQPEYVRPGAPEWQRHRLHNAANPLHVQQSLGLRGEDRLVYRVAWVGGCVLYDTDKLRAAGGFGFWKALPPQHCGEDVLAQLLVARRFGGCGVLPSGVYHLELPTTVPDRRTNAPEVLAYLLEA